MSAAGAAVSTSDVDRAAAIEAAIVPTKFKNPATILDLSPISIESDGWCLYNAFLYPFGLDGSVNAQKLACLVADKFREKMNEEEYFNVQIGDRVLDSTGKVIPDLYGVASQVIAEEGEPYIMVGKSHRKVIYEAGFIDSITTLRIPGNVDSGPIVYPETQEFFMILDELFSDIKTVFYQDKSVTQRNPIQGFTLKSALTTSGQKRPKPNTFYVFIKYNGSNHFDSLKPVWSGSLNWSRKEGLPRLTQEALDAKSASCLARISASGSSTPFSSSGAAGGAGLPSSASYTAAAVEDSDAFSSSSSAPSTASDAVEDSAAVSSLPPLTGAPLPRASPQNPIQYASTTPFVGRKPIGPNSRSYIELGAALPTAASSQSTGGGAAAAAATAATSPPPFAATLPPPRQAPLGAAASAAILPPPQAPLGAASAATPPPQPAATAGADEDNPFAAAAAPPPQAPLGAAGAGASPAPPAPELTEALQRLGELQRRIDQLEGAPAAAASAAEMAALQDQLRAARELVETQSAAVVANQRLFQDQITQLTLRAQEAHARAAAEHGAAARVLAATAAAADRAVAEARARADAAEIQVRQAREAAQRADAIATRAARSVAVPAAAGAAAPTLGTTPEAIAASLALPAIVRASRGARGRTVMPTLASF
jgi:hypothetical protein